MTHALTRGELAAYEAPFPDPTYQAGICQFPLLIAVQPDSSGVSANREAWQKLGQFTKPFLTLSSARDPVSQAVANRRQLDFTTRFQQAISALADRPLPVIAVVHGQCLGGGIDLITACDVRVAAADATFSVRDTRIGIVADVGTLQRLPKVVTAGQVAELAHTGKDICATRAEKIGLVIDVHADFDAAHVAAQDMANEIAAKSPLAVRGTKFILQRGEDLTPEQGLLLDGLYTLATSLQPDALREAMKAFMEKRPAKFTGS